MTEAATGQINMLKGPDQYLPLPALLWGWVGAALARGPTSCTLCSREAINSSVGVIKLRQLDPVPRVFQGWPFENDFGGIDSFRKIRQLM